MTLPSNLLQQCVATSLSLGVYDASLLPSALLLHLRCHLCRLGLSSLVPSTHLSVWAKASHWSASLAHWHSAMFGFVISRVLVCLPLLYSTWQFPSMTSHCQHWSVSSPWVFCPKAAFRVQSVCLYVLTVLHPFWVTAVPVSFPFCLCSFISLLIINPQFIIFALNTQFKAVFKIAN